MQPISFYLSISHPLCVDQQHSGCTSVCDIHVSKCNCRKDSPLTFYYEDIRGPSKKVEETLDGEAQYIILMLVCVCGRTYMKLVTRCA